MKKILILFAAAIAFGVQAQQTKEIRCEEYPDALKTDTVIDNYFGVEVADPYRWMEDETHPKLEMWIEAQNHITQNYLEQIPYREKIKERLTEIWNYEKYGTPFKEADNLFFFYNTGLQNQSVLYRQRPGGEAEVLLNPNEFSKEGTIALSTVKASPDGRTLAYGISRGGSDWQEFYVMDIESKKKLADSLNWIKFSGIAWDKAGQGFYYSRYDEPKEKEKKLSAKNEFQKVYYHKIGTPQIKDKLIYEDRTQPLRTFYPQTTEDGKYLILYLSEGATPNDAIYYKDLSKENAPIKPLIDNFENSYRVVDHINGKFLMLTNKNAPRKKLVYIDPANPDEKAWKTVIPEQEEVLEGITLAGGKIVAQYMKDAGSRLYIYDMQGNKESEIALPALGTVAGFSGKKEDSIGYFSFRSFIYPTTVYKYNLNTNTTEVYKKPEVDFNAEEYVTKQVFYKSKDGTKVPMFITHKKGLELNGQNPTLLYGYGGFNINILPRFSVANLVFLENGGIFAVANLRGGGEYGEEWHEAAMLLKKQNVFDDFITAAEYLIEQKYTNPKKLAIEGRSNGGLLVGAAMTQRPDLFAVALPAVGVMDMLRFHKFTIGWAWVPEYGSSEDSVHFKNLFAYSPLHNIREECYPATLVTTADHDDRVVPAHSFKFISQLQEHQQCKNPTLIRIETKAGHGAGKPTSKQIEEAADIWSFVFWNLGMKME